MTVIARRIRANPVRTTGDTWELISNLVCAHDESKRTHLDEVGNVAAMLIAEEHAQSNPIIVSGCGPQVRIYTLHGDAAIDGTEAKEDELLLTTSDNWEVSLPANGDDFEFAFCALSNSDHVNVYDSS